MRLDIRVNEKKSVVNSSASVVDDCISLLQQQNLKILIIGNSHAACLPHSIAESSGDRIRIVSVQKPEYSHFFKRGVPTQSLRDYYHPTHVFSILGGNRHYDVGLIEHPQKIQVLVGGEDEFLAEGRELVTNAVIRDVLLEAAHDPLAMMRNIRAFYSCTVTHVMPPPPIALEDISNMLDRALRSMGEFTTAPVWHRLRCYRIYCSVLSDFCAKEGFLSLDPPDDAASDEGFLKTEYYGRNATHANDKYGLLLFQKILQDVIMSSDVSTA